MNLSYRIHMIPNGPVYLEWRYEEDFKIKGEQKGVR